MGTKLTPRVRTKRKKDKPPVPRRPKPPCFTGRQWAEWREVAVDTNLNARFGYCEDCTREYQRRMIQEGRCVRPDTTFEIDKDGFVYGVVWKSPSRKVIRMIESNGL